MASSRTGAGGGVTFTNVRPGMYVVLMTMAAGSDPSRDDTARRETIIAHEFQIGGSVPVTVTAAVGRSLRR